MTRSEPDSTQEQIEQALGIELAQRVEDPKQYAIWWTCQNDILTMKEEAPAWLPAYIRREFRSRVGRSGSGRLWVAEMQFDGEPAVVPWPDTHLAKAIAGYYIKSTYPPLQVGNYGGIVLHPQDAKLVAFLPGFVTDCDLNYWRE